MHSTKRPVEINRDQFRLTGTDIVHPGKILIDDRRLTRQCDEEERKRGSTRISFHANRTNLVSFDKFAIVVPWKETNRRIRYNARFRHWSGNHRNLFHQRALDFRFAQNPQIDFHFLPCLWIYGPLPFIPLPFSLLSLAYRARWSRNNWLVISLQLTSRMYAYFLDISRSPRWQCWSWSC